MQLFHFLIPKRRKIDFEISVLIRDLANVPLVSGLYYIRWRIRHATHASGFTERAPIKDHCIYWNHPINTMAQLVISKQDMLGACELKLDVYQELAGGKETHFIGSLSINLAENANAGVITRRYLLENCKFNSTLKLSTRVNPKSDIGAHYQLPTNKRPQITTGRRDKSPKADERSIAETITTTSDRRTPYSIQRLKKSQSATDFPNYCRQYSSYCNPDDPSPTDLVEQFFSRNQNELPAS